MKIYLRTWPQFTCSNNYFVSVGLWSCSISHSVQDMGSTCQFSYKWVKSRSINLVSIVGAIYGYKVVTDEVGTHNIFNIKRQKESNSGRGHPPLHPGDQGSSVPHQCDPSSVGRRRGPPLLPVIRGGRPVLIHIPPPPFLYHSVGGTTEHKAPGPAPETCLLARHDMSP